MDGSVDTKQHGKKYIFARYVDKDNILDVKTCLIVLTTATERGALGLANCVIASLKKL